MPCLEGSGAVEREPESRRTKASLWQHNTPNAQWHAPGAWRVRQSYAHLSQPPLSLCPHVHKSRMYADSWGISLVSPPCQALPDYYYYYTITAMHFTRTINAHRGVKPCRGGNRAQSSEAFCPGDTAMEAEAGHSPRPGDSSSMFLQDQ